MNKLGVQVAKKISNQNARRLLKSSVFPKNIQKALINQIFVDTSKNLLTLNKNILLIKYKELKNLYPQEIYKLKKRNAEKLSSLFPTNRNLKLVAKYITPKEKLLLNTRNRVKALKTIPGQHRKTGQRHFNRNINSNDEHPWWNSERYQRVENRERIRRSVRNKFPENVIEYSLYKPFNNRNVLDYYRKVLKSQTSKQRIVHSLFGY